jgi:BolA protein
MSMQIKIQEKLNTELEPLLASVENESHMHGGPATESHFKLTVVSDEFQDVALVKRHQLVYKILKEELQGGVHALAMHLYAPTEWSDRNQAAPDSPDCRGGSKS